MRRQEISIDGIPAILWGMASDKLFIAVHGDQSNKADNDIILLAQTAVSKGYQVLSFDLPEHGGRKEEKRLCNAQNCVKDLKQIFKYAHACTNNISLFGCSIGAYFSMLAYKDESIRQTLFLSPVVDMKRIINNIMSWFDISEEDLEREQEIITPIKTLYWDYYQYVLDNPVEWNKVTSLLYGANDNLCELDYVNDFVKHTNANMTIFENGEHFFGTEDQLAFLQKWLCDNIK